MKYDFYTKFMSKGYFYGLILLLICFALTILIYKNPEYYSKKEHDYATAHIILKWQGRELYLPICDSVSEELLHKQQKVLKVITFIDGNCGVCLNDLNKWKPLIEQFRSLANVSFVFYVNAIDFDGLVKYVSDENPFPIPLINDAENSFFIKNSLEQDKMFQTFLIDSCNRILLIGNPIINEKIFALYKETIQKQKH